MAAITTVDGLLTQVSAGKDAYEPIYGEFQTARVAAGVNGTAVTSMARQGWVKAIPSMPSGIAAYIPAEISVHPTANPAGLGLLVCETISLGTLNMGTNTFTDGSAMPTRTELNASNATTGLLIAEVTTALNATPGTWTVTYVDQDGNAAETTAAQTPGASAVIGSISIPTLNSTDWGVRDITAAAQSAGTTPSGIITFWGCIPILQTQFGHLVGPASFAEELINNGIVRRLTGSNTIGVFCLGDRAVGASSGYIRYIGDST